jgi:hypothetical protein
MCTHSFEPWCLLTIIKDHVEEVKIKFVYLEEYRKCFSIGPFNCQEGGTGDVDAGIIYLEKSNVNYNQILDNIKKGFLFSIETRVDLFLTKYGKKVWKSYIINADALNKEPIQIVVSKATRNNNT